jgi:beta-mannanase
VAAWRVFYQILRERTGPLTDSSDPTQIAAVFTVGNSAFSNGKAEEFYPGDDFVDIIGIDVYNWHWCQGSERQWLELDELLVPGLAFARARNKPIAIPEFGSVEDPANPAAKAQWMRNAATTLTELEVTDDLAFAAWFDVTGAGGAWPECVWDHDSSPESLSGFADLVSATSKRS